MLREGRPKKAKKPNDLELQKIKATVTTLYKAKEKLSKARDEFREALREAEDILEAWDDGVDTIDCALRNMDHGVDRLSELV